MNISIIGCGWLGLPLAQELIKKGHLVKGSTTSGDRLGLLAAHGVQPFLINVSPEGISGRIGEFLTDAEVLIVNIPPGLRKDPELDFAGGIGFLADTVEESDVQKLIYVSSTAVYKDTETIPEYTEGDAANGDSPSAIQLREAEQIFLTSSFNTCVLRFGGLIGEDRHPVKYLAGRTDLGDPLAPVNLIHRKDCIGIIKKLIKTEDSSGIYNAVYREHPSRKEYYELRAQEEGLPEPQFDDSKPSRGKIISSLRLGKELNYNFKQAISGGLNSAR